MAVYDDEHYEAVSEAIRTRLGIRDQPRPDMVTVIFKLKHLGMIADYLRVPDSEMPEDLAAFNPETRVLSLQETTFVAANEVLGTHSKRQRARFTIAHELGHVVFKHKRTRHRNVSNRAIEKIAPTIIKDESEADKFAAAFLVPLYLVGNPYKWTAERLAEHFEISLSAAKIRMTELERLYRRANGIARPLPASIVEHLEKARSEGHPIKSLKIEEQRKIAEAKAKKQ